MIGFTFLLTWLLFGVNALKEGDLCPGCIDSLKEWWKN
ncbi:hypothetical protein LCGC14_1460330 [marine sediment metagenome]|uniref:Uncharacterized protein n=1 Tax=marine sediment metagenome TaxID=412755 RepID=A0A0F9JFV5_9ZZZZ